MWDQAKKVRGRLIGNDHSRGLTQAPFCLELSLSYLQPLCPCRLQAADSSRDLRDGSGADVTEGDRRFLRGSIPGRENMFGKSLFFPPLPADTARNPKWHAKNFL